MSARSKKTRKASLASFRLRLAAVLLLLAVTAWGLLCCPPPAEWFVDDTRFAAEISVAAQRHGIDPQLVRAMIFQESRFRPDARGRDGEIGLMQILPGGAAAEYARIHRIARPGNAALAEVTENLEIGCWYLGRAMRRWQEFDHGVELALAQYNAGERRAKKWQPETREGGVLERITIRSTRSYVDNIMKRYRKYQAETK